MDSDHADVRRTVLSVLETCSNCKSTYQLDDARIVGRNGSLWVLTVTCSVCQTQAFVAAVVGDGLEDETVAQLTDEATDRQPVIDDDVEPDEPITVDDVLDLHEYLESFDGDFHALFHRHHR
jgi:hypothetical protein